MTHMGSLAGRGRVGVAVLAAAALAFSSCGVFDTRDSPPPGSGGPPVPRKEPINAENVLFNYTNAVEYFSQANYEEALSGDFVFEPDEEDRQFFISTRGEDIFLGWDRSKEMAAVVRIFAESESLALTFVQETGGEVSATEAYYEMDYEFKRRVVRSEQADSVAVLKGQAKIYLHADDRGYWSIYKWQDVKLASPDTTWGWLKGSVTGG